MCHDSVVPMSGSPFSCPRACGNPTVNPPSVILLSARRRFPCSSANTTAASVVASFVVNVQRTEPICSTPQTRPTFILLPILSTTSSRHLPLRSRHVVSASIAMPSSTANLPPRQLSSASDVRHLPHRNPSSVVVRQISQAHSTLHHLHPPTVTLLALPGAALPFLPSSPVDPREHLASCYLARSLCLPCTPTKIPLWVP